MARPEIEAKTALGARLRAIRTKLGDPDRGEFAKALGVSKNTLASYERGETEPTATVLGVYREKFGISLRWITLNTGSMFADPTKAPASSRSVDKTLMLRLGNIIDAAYRKAGQTLAGADNAAEAAELYNELLKLVANINDPEDVNAALPQVTRIMERKLAANATSPGTGKREAS